MVIRNVFLLTLSAVLTSTASAQSEGSRFQTKYTPGSGFPPITIDTVNTGWGFANQYARQNKLQGRMLWIDGTANLERVSSEEKIVALVAKIAETGFNTVVFDVKPISGQLLYPSKFAPKIEKWKTQSLPKDFDPLKYMARECRKQGLSLLISMNALSEGHNLFKEGPGYARETDQSIYYISKPIIKNSKGNYSFRIKSSGALEDGEVLATTNPSDIPEGVTPVTINANYIVVPSTKDTKGQWVVPKGGSLLIGKGSSVSLLNGLTPGAKAIITDAVSFERSGLHPTLQYPLMMSPIKPSVQAHSLNIVREIYSNYDVDGIVYDDRLRYGGLYADFSPEMLTAFEKYVKAKQPLTWPDDVFRYTYSPTLKKGIRPGKYFNEWLNFRAIVLRDYILPMQAETRKRNKTFGIYAGSWYGEYQQYGINYASSQLEEAGFWFLTRKYQQTGLGDTLDFITTGCYYPTATIYDALTKGTDMGATVESAGQLSNRLMNDKAWVYAGISLDQFAGNPQGLAAVVQAACATTQGIMVFDLSHNIEPMWPVFKALFNQPMSAPHKKAGALKEVNKLREAFVQAGGKIPPVPINAGSSGVGF